LDDPHARVPALDALSTITRATRHQTRVLVATSGPIRKRSNSQTDPVERGQRQVDQVRRRLGMQMDDRQFQSALVDSQVSG
jgi:rapamycin-insensitive companion of mTOR